MRGLPPFIVAYLKSTTDTMQRFEDIDWQRQPEGPSIRFANFSSSAASDSRTTNEFDEHFPFGPFAPSAASVLSLVYCVLYKLI